MVGVRVGILRYVDDHQPGWVECRLTDAHGRVWAFVEKVPIVTTESLDATSDYPRPGVIACEVVAGEGSAIIQIDTARPWGVAATTGETRFEVRPAQLEWFDWN